MNFFRTHKTRQRAAGLAAIAGVAVLAAGCGGGGLPIAPAAHDSGQPPAAAGPGGSSGPGRQQPNPGSSPPGNQGFVSPAQEQAGTGSRSAVTGGALFGGTNQLTSEEGKLGRKLAIVRVYYRLGETFPTPPDRQFMAAGSTLLVSLDSPTSGGPSYAAIAAGREDATISTFLKAMNQAAIQYHLGAIYICFEHEADSPPHLRLGSPAEFVKAWDHVHQLAQSGHLNWNAGGHLHWVLILEHSDYFRTLPGFLRRSGGASGFWPGPGEVDIVAADGYNHQGCKHNGSTASVTPEDLFDPVLSFAQSHGGLPVFIAEWGSQANEGSEQPTFISQMQGFVSANHEIAAVSYFDWRSAQNPACTSVINNQPASLSAMAAMGHSAALQGHVVG
jgi:hypothetical protein